MNTVLKAQKIQFTHRNLVYYVPLKKKRGGVEFQRRVNCREMIRKYMEGSNGR